VTVAAIDAHRPDVVRVAEWNRLFARIALARGISGIGDQFERQDAKHANCDDRKDNACPG